MKKRLLVIIMAVTLTLAGCGAGNNEENAEGNAAAELTATVETATEESSSESTEESSIAASEADSSSKNETSGKENAATSEDSIAKEDKASSEASKKPDATKEASATAATSEATAKQESQKPEETKEEQTPQAPQETNTEQTAPAAPEKIDYGRILFVGDSRTVDMFSADQDRINGEVHDGILVYAEDGANYTFHIGVMGIVDTSNFDTLITWMGCNDKGVFSNYEPHYNGLLNEGKRIIVCTVGPTNDEALVEWDRGYYDNARQIEFNAQLVNWANQHGVKVIDLYSYLCNTGDVYLNPSDGIHYMPQPTTGIWNIIRSNLN